VHIESFNSILEREVIRRFEFGSFEDTKATVGRFIEFYNRGRLHSAIGYMTPREVYLKWKEKNTVR
jgi:putative transposase